MNTRKLAWGVTGGVSFLLAVACGGTKVNDVGNVDEGGSAGSGGKGNVGGRDHSEDETGGTSTAGTTYYDDIAGSGGCVPGPGYTCNGTAGTSTGGYSTGGYGTGGNFDNTAGTGSAGYSGSGGAPTDCFAQQSIYAEPTPSLAPQNTIFVDTHGVTSDTVKNYADQQVFTNIGWVPEVYANFPASPAAADTALLLPAKLSQVGANLGQVYVARAACADKPAAGHKLAVEFWWKHGAVGALPTHGVALGAVSSKGKAVWFEDSAKTYAVGDAQTKRLTNTLNRLVVEHTFAEDDATDAGKVTLGVWLLPDAEFASTFYVGAVKWD